MIVDTCIYKYKLSAVLNLNAVTLSIDRQYSSVCVCLSVCVWVGQGAVKSLQIKHVAACRAEKR